MESATSVCSTVQEDRNFKFVWKIANIADSLAALDKQSYRSELFQLYKNCESCAFRFTLIKERKIESCLSDKDKKTLEFEENLPYDDMVVRIGFCGSTLSGDPGYYFGKHLLEEHGVWRSSWTQYIIGRDGNRRWETHGENFYYFNYSMQLDSLRSWGDGSLDFRFNLRTTKFVHSLESLPAPINQSGRLVMDMKRLLESGSLSDLEIQTTGEVLKAHKTVLAMRSPVFKAMFEADMRENQEGSLRLNHIDAHVMKVFIEYIYTGDLELEASGDYELATDLLKLADQYQVDSLKALCAIRLIDKLAISTVLDLLSIADTYRCEDLKEEALEFISIKKQALAKQVDLTNHLLGKPEIAKLVMDRLFS